MENIRRTTTKSVIWRFIGIFWTWGGAYIIILFLPEKRQNAFTIALLVTIWHHSTRMIMYYFYERIWTRIKWGNTDNKDKPLSRSTKFLWIFGVIILIGAIFWLLLFVTPNIKKNQNTLMQKNHHISTNKK